MNKWMRLATALCAAILCLGAPAAAAEAVLVRAGRLIDVVEGRVLADQLIRIEDGRHRRGRPRLRRSRAGRR